MDEENADEKALYDAGVLAASIRGAGRWGPPANEHGGVVQDVVAVQPQKIHPGALIQDILAIWVDEEASPCDTLIQAEAQHLRL